MRGDPRRNEGNCPIDTPITLRVREPKSVYDDCKGQLGEVPPGARLRPYDDQYAKPKIGAPSNATDSENWLVDDQKLFLALNDSMKLHHSNKRRSNHTPRLVKSCVTKVGFGIRMSLKCRRGNCKFESPPYDLYQKDENGQPLPNVQVGVAMAKTDITPKSVEALSATMNMCVPSLTTLHKSYSKAMNVAECLSEDAMRDNRNEVTTTLRLRGEVESGIVPMADVAIDGQFSNRSYHFPTGKSDSVSVPVVEQVTGKGLLIQHVNLSHRDGTLSPQTHINSGETVAAQLNYEKTYTSSEFPLHFGVVTTDGDTGLIKALEAGRKNVGEGRALQRRNCVFHAESAAKRKFNRESLVKLTQAQKDLMTKHATPLSPTNSPNQCAACSKEFASMKGLNIHRRSCKGDRALECTVKGLEPLFWEWEKKNPSTKTTVKEKKEWRDGIRRWVLKRMKQELNLGLHAANPKNIALSDDGIIHEALYLAGKTIIPCLSGNHDKCLSDSRGCQGMETPPDYDFLPSKAALGFIPSQTVSWLSSVVDTLLSKEALGTLIVNGKKATTSLVESAHKEIRLPVPKGRVYRKNEAKLIKSGEREMKRGPKASMNKK